MGTTTKADARQDVAVVLSGYGPVGQALVDRLAAEGDDLVQAYGVRPQVRAIRGSRAEFRPREGKPVPPRAAWRPRPSLAETLKETGAQVLLQAIPSSPAL